VRPRGRRRRRLRHDRLAAARGRAAWGATSERRDAPRHRARAGRLFRFQSPGGQALTYGLLVDVSAAGVPPLAGRPVPAGAAELAPHPLAGRKFPFRIERGASLPGGCALVAGPRTAPVTDGERGRWPRRRRDGLLYR